MQELICSSGEFFQRSIEILEKEISLRAKSFFLEITRNHGKNVTVLVVNLLGCNWTNLCKIWANFCLCLSKVLVILSKFPALLGKFILIQTGFSNFALAQILKEKLGGTTD